jgi:hypothetical protein
MQFYSSIRPFEKRPAGTISLLGYRGFVMNPVGPSPPGLRVSMERLSIEVDSASWMVTRATVATVVTVLLVLGWLLTYR